MTNKKLALNRCLVALLMMLTALVTVAGCEMDSFMDPSVVGRWESTPVTLPILDRLDVIEDSSAEPLQVTHVRPEDLIPDVQEYVIGPGDTLIISIFELIATGQESVQQRTVDARGTIRLPVVGAVEAAGLTPTDLEERIRQTLAQQGVLRDAMVSVTLAQAQQNTYTVIGEPETGGTAVGPYVIPRPNFRLLDAVAAARGVPGRTKKLFIYRQSALQEEVLGRRQQQPTPDGAQEQVAPAPEDPSQLIEELLQGVDQEPERRPVPEEERIEPAPAGVEGGLEPDRPAVQWVNVGGQWVRVEQSEEERSDMLRQADLPQDAELSELITQRIIEVPYDRLLDGDIRYNIVIRPGDVIRVPSLRGGFVYVMGTINRPGAFVVPGENDLTLKQLVASAGGLSPIATPERVDLIRRVDANTEAIVRINVRAIFEGTEPDFFLKPNDMLNFGTSFVATPLAIVRNGLRATYGFGFVLDRNFADDVFGRQ